MEKKKMGRKEVRWLPQGEGKEGEAAGKKRKKEGKKEERQKLLVRDALMLVWVNDAEKYSTTKHLITDSPECRDG